MVISVVVYSFLCLFSVVSHVEMPVPQTGSVKYKLECEVQMNTDLLSILFTDFLKALQTVSQHVRKNRGLCVNE